MNKQTRILTAIICALVLGCMFAYHDMQKYGTDFQAHPNLPVVILTDFFGASLSVMLFYFASRWLYRRKERKLKEAGEDKFYEEVARELQEKTLVAGLWTKAFAEMGGDDAKARALYIKYRVAQLAEASRKPNKKQEQTEPSKPDKQIASAPTKSKTGKILAVLAGAIIVIVILANSGSNSTSSSSTSSANSSGGNDNTPPPASTPPVCKALDEKNGFKDFKFGMTPEEARLVLPPTQTFTNLDSNNTIFLYDNTPANRIGDFSFAVLRLSFFEGHLYRIELYFDKFQNEILEAFKVNFGGPFDTDSWKMGDKPVQAKAWQGDKVFAAFLSSPSTPSASVIIYDIEADKKAQQFKDDAPKHTQTEQSPAVQTPAEIEFDKQKKLAEKGNADAQCVMGFYYDVGVGVTKDYAEAFKWYRMAANQGNAGAEYILGTYYAKGFGVDKDEVEAAKWYRKSAEQGDVDAENKLGDCYAYGWGVETNLPEASKWYSLAARSYGEKARLNQ